jgi:LuxR family maltose regulon positive regulatory protein
MLYTEGISYLLEDDLERADQILVRAFGEADRVGAPPLAAVILAERCIAAEQRGDWPAAMKLVQQAVTIVEAGQFDDYWTSALVYAWASRAALHSGKIAEARSWLGRAARLRPLLSYVLPVMSVQALLEMARCYLALSDPGGAVAVLNQVREILQQRPALGALSRQAAQLRSQLDRNGSPDVGASALTAAELRLLPLLSTHLSYQEIGERLYVSKNTVKSQAYSAFRKLGANSRSEAVSRAQDLGLDYL